MTGAPAQQRKTTYREVFAQGRFRLLYCATGTVVAGHTLQIMALSVLVYHQTRSPLLGAVTFGIAFLPQLLGGTLLGSLADRARPRRLILAGYATECASALCLAVVPMPVPARLALVACVGFLTPLYLGATNRLIADVFVPASGADSGNHDAYVLARSMMQVTASGAQLAGLAAGGVAVAALGARHSLLITASLFVLAGLLIRLRLPDLDATDHQDTAGESRSALRRSADVNKTLIASPEVRRLLLAQWLPPAFATAAESLLVPYANVRGYPAGTSGLLLACLPVGMILGDVLVGRLFTPGTRERLTPWLVLMIGSPLLAFALHPPLPVTLGLLAITGFGFSYALGVQRRFIDAVPAASRGQAFTLRSSGLMTAQGTGPAVFGALAQFSSIDMAIAFAGIATVLCVPLLRRR